MFIEQEGKKSIIWTFISLYHVMWFVHNNQYYFAKYKGLVDLLCKQSYCWQKSSIHIPWIRCVCYCMLQSCSDFQHLLLPIFVTKHSQVCALYLAASSLVFFSPLLQPLMESLVPQVNKQLQSLAWQKPVAACLLWSQQMLKTESSLSVFNIWLWCWH